MNAKTLGQIGYEAYGNAGPQPWKTFDGRPMPTWDDLGQTSFGQAVRERWEIAAVAIAEAGISDMVMGG